MTSRKPLVISSGVITELPSGDVLTGFARSLPFFLVDLSPSNVPMVVTSTGVELPFFEASGSANNIVMAV